MSPFEILTIVAIVATVPVIGHLLWSKRQAGLVLLKLGRSRRHNLFLVGGALFILMAGWDLLEAAPVVDAGPLWGLFTGIFFILLGWSGPKIREAGIFSPDRYPRDFD